MKQSLNEVKRMQELAGTLKESEGYVEAMGPEFHEAIKLIELAWYKWKNAPMTSPKDKLPAKRELLSYFDMILD